MDLLRQDTTEGIDKKWYSTPQYTIEIYIYSIVQMYSTM